jgi:hypothetical protein
VTSLQDPCPPGKPNPAADSALTSVNARLGTYRRFDADRVRRYLTSNPAAADWVLTADAEELRSHPALFPRDNDAFGRFLAWEAK